MMLNDRDICKLALEHNMITDYLDFKTQLQPNGFDLTLDKVAVIRNDDQGLTYEPGRGTANIDFSNTKRAIPNFTPIPWYLEGLSLIPGHYLFRAAERFFMPPDIAALCVARSTLNRCGGFLDSAAVDAGYSGPLEFPVRLTLPVHFHYRARFVQILFFKLTGPADKIYNGIYKQPVETKGFAGDGPDMNEEGAK